MTQSNQDQNNSAFLDHVGEYLSREGQDQAVAAWMESLGFVLWKVDDCWWKYDMRVDKDTALFFHTICQKAKREARRAGKLEAARYFKNYMISSSPFIDQIIDPYVAQLTPLQDTRQEEN